MTSDAIIDDHSDTPSHRLQGSYVDSFLLLRDAFD